MQNEGTAKGRISNVWDRGAGSLPSRYLWRCTTRWVATPTLGDCLRLYLATSSASATAALADGGLTFGDAELTTENALLLNCIPLGGVTAEAIDKSFCSSGIIAIHERLRCPGWLEWFWHQGDDEHRHRSCCHIHSDS